MEALNLSMKSSHFIANAINKKLTIFPATFPFFNNDYQKTKNDKRKKLTLLIEKDDDSTLLALYDAAFNSVDPKIELSKNPFKSNNQLKPVNR